MPDKDPLTGLALLRKPFAPNQISHLPKPTKRQTDEVRADFKKGIRCQICGGWHHKDVVHLDYVGHAALTDRLLDCDPEWNWEPVAASETGEPRMDENGGMWIRLTVCGVTRLGYGHPDGKRGGDAIKEVIGDALRNAAMRFGAALDLWHKGTLHDDGPAEDEAQAQAKPKVGETPGIDGDKPSQATIAGAVSLMEGAVSLPDLKSKWDALGRNVQTAPAVTKAKDARKTQLQTAPPADDVGLILDDEIQY